MDQFKENCSVEINPDGLEIDMVRLHPDRTCNVRLRAGHTTHVIKGIPQQFFRLTAAQAAEFEREAAEAERIKQEEAAAAEKAARDAKEKADANAALRRKEQERLESENEAKRKALEGGDS